MPETATKRDKTHGNLFKNHSSIRLSLALVFLLLKQQRSARTHVKSNKNHDRQLPEHDARVRVRVLVPSVFMFQGMRENDLESYFLHDDPIFGKGGDEY